ncbi:MAG: DNA primase, partial [Burkholderiaceae bacterium]
MSIPQSFLQELLARIDVVEVVGRHVQLKKGGANYMGLCPFHGEKSPSFSVSPSKQFYHCFGCGANGDAISFLMAHTGMSFIEAVKDLSQQAGLAVPEEQATPQERERLSAQRDHHSALTTLLATIAAGYQKHLKTSQRAIAYLKSRGLSGQIAKTFGLGFAPEGWRTLASMVPDYSDERLVESGMVIAKEGAATPTDGEARGSRENDSNHINQEKRYDRFRDRIMFPIRNVKGETIGFGGRVLDRGEPKYLNSPETPVFSKGRELYGLFEARTAIRQQGFALVTEGYMDVVALAQLGFPNAVATLGTACTPDHIQKLFRFTESVVFSFDGDAAGRRAAVKAMHAALPFATDTRSIKFLFLPAEHDPDSFIRAHGTEAFAVSVQD